ncbi:MAG: type I DNA topoisomerase [Trueperaceae bacterium]|nr:type I DNA topoisomerase [Trueperaceae bacterium]
MKRLVIVESPTKARTIKRFLPADYQVEASMGHVRDLPSSAAEIPDKYKGSEWARLGVNVDAGFEPLYVVSPKKKAVVKNLQSALAQAGEVYIATDEDREGESIGWHLVEVLNPRVPVKRMVFHEITERAILEALSNTRDIDAHLVEAQETRRVLDRLVGYAISPLLWRKIAPKLSAGRVQSVAVRLLVMRERERMSFVPAAYWDLSARLAKGGAGTSGRFEAALTHVGGRRVAGGRDYDAATGRLKAELRRGDDVIELAEADARRLAAAAERAAWKVLGLEEREQTRAPAAPFTTSTLQQEASRKLGLAARDTMRVAQSLYENGYITYMRTDSTNLSEEALAATRAAIEARYGPDYLGGARKHKGAARNAQEAHEAIRPAGTEMRTADEHALKGLEAAVYDLVWKRTVASQMADARLKFVTARIGATPDGEPELSFRASGRTVLFPGFFRAYVEGSDDPDAALDDRDQPLPPLTQGDSLDCAGVTAAGHETKPPARYTDASLVKLLETEGIGRPSTYASIIDTIQARGYARKQGQQLVPTFTAFATNNLLERQFRQLVDTEFTARMERVLDDIAAGERASDTYLKDFYLGDNGIVRLVDDALGAIDARQISTVENAAWAPYVVRVGRYGPYVEGPLDGEVKTTSLPADLAPGDITKAELERYLVEANMGDVVVATEPASGQPVLLKRGPFGPYLQLGDAGPGGEKPKRVSLPPNVAPHDVGAELALELIALPARLGEHPDDGKVVEVGIGRYGPYVKHGGVYASIPKGEFLLDVTLARALELLAQKKRRGNAPLKELGPDPRTGEPIELYEGRFGPYVKRGSVNASLPRTLPLDVVTVEQASDLLDAREAAGGGKRQAKGRAAARGKTRPATKGATKGTARGKKGKAASKAGSARARGAKARAADAKPKATPEQLAAYLDELAPDDAAVLRLTLGAGAPALNVAEAAERLGIDEADALARNKRGLFKLRMSFGRDRTRGSGG